MSRERLANAFDKAAEAMAELALELRANEPDGARPSVAASVPTGAPARAAGVPPAPAARSVDTGSCPKHGTPWTEGQYGAFCRQMTDDPAWGKPKTDRDGNPVLWCKLTPKNAPDWVAVHGLPA
jgi:hypothetical protein